MTVMSDALDRFRRQPSPPEGAPNPNGFRLVSTVDEPVGGDIEEVWARDELPAEVMQASAES